MFHKALLSLILLSTLSLSACIVQYPISPSSTTADNREKVSRFDYMENRWSNFNNTWSEGEKVTPYVLQTTFNINKPLASEEINEFENLEHQFSWIQRYLAMCGIRAVRFYINPPE